MAFHIIQLGPGSNERIVHEKSYETLEEARSRASKEIEASEGDRGYDTLRGYWWCRDGRGRTRFIYVVD
ncbi:hypothetical protein J8I29_18105 [Labrys sp. LIt4]|uniref:Uncharacterized protein n=1 Tax=Labrys okinawensis TaxID=346911 RepID=A0A2S9QIW9_9HYPH|nr:MULTISPECIES: hypothetical protein [Labrys]MBP0581247.1 hypothetical protein [Labrys sp. LIt4]PRH89304.1 hypothetical protein C5L14_01540 [Labrys okinawensis]